MRAELLSLLRCPECRGPVTVAETWRARDALLEEGVLAWFCDQRYPVIAGIPRLLPAALAGVVEQAHADFFARHPLLRRDPVRGGAARRTVERYFDRSAERRRALAVRL